MAPTFRHGKNAAFFLDSTAGTLINYSSGVTSVTVSRSMDPAEVTSYGDNDRVYIPGLRGATISVEGVFSSTHAAKLDGVFASNSTSSRTAEFNPDGSTASGRRLYTAETYMTSLEYGAPVDDAVSLSFELIITGAVTSTNN